MYLLHLMKGHLHSGVTFLRPEGVKTRPASVLNNFKNRYRKGLSLRSSNNCAFAMEEIITLQQKQVLFRHLLWIGDWLREHCFLFSNVLLRKNSSTCEVLGSITSRCSENEPTLLPRKEDKQRPDLRERQTSSLVKCRHVIPKIIRVVSKWSLRIFFKRQRTKRNNFFLQ